MPKSQVEDIEIMYSAPPKYNVRGAAINVLLKSKKEKIRSPFGRVK